MGSLVGRAVSLVGRAVSLVGRACRDHQLSSPITSSTADRTAPDETNSTAVSISGDRKRSGPGAPTPCSSSRRTTAPVAGAGRRALGRPRGRAQAQPAGGGHQLDRDDPGEPVDRPTQLAGSRPAHGHVVLLHRARRDRVDAGGDGQPLELRDDPGLGVLRDHQAAVDAGVVREEGGQVVVARPVQEPVAPALRDRGHVGRHDREEVEHVGDRRTMEVAVGLHPARPVGRAARDQHHRVVDGARELAPRDRGGVLHGVACGTVHLGRATQGVGVLDPVEAVLAVARHDAGVGEQPGQVAGRQSLPHLRSQGLEVGREDAIGTHLSLDAHRRGDVGGAQQRPQVGDREHQHAEHAVGAVDQGQPFLGPKLHGRQPCGRESVRGRHQCSVRVADVALPHQCQGAVGQGRQVAGAAERAVLPHHGRDARRQQRGEQLRRLPSYAGVAGGEGREPQQHEAAHDLALDLGAGPRGVRADQRALELLTELAWDVAGGEGAEPGRDPVRRRGRGRELLHHRPGPVDRVQRLVRQLHGGPCTRHRDHVVDGHRADAHQNGLHAAIQLPGVRRRQRRRALRVWDTRRAPSEGPAPKGKAWCASRDPCGNGSLTVSQLG